MQTLELKEAAALIKIHPSTLLAKARSGEAPAAKPGKKWVFIDVDLIQWLREQYTSKQQGTSHKGKACTSLKEKKAGTGIINFPLKEEQYTDLLEPKTKKKHKK